MAFNRREFISAAMAATVLPSVRPGIKLVKSEAQAGVVRKLTDRFQVGINLAGLEFNGTRYPVPTGEELIYYKTKGINTFRLPFSWERIQPALNDPLDSHYLGLIQKIVAQAALNSQTILLDVHNYARYNSDVIGTGSVTIEAFSNLWLRIATIFRGNHAIYGYDLMNEPHNMPTSSTWPSAAQAAVDTIRSVDPTTTIFIEGDGWAGAHQWRYFNENLDIKDTSNRMVYSAHNYADVMAGGSYKLPYSQDGATPMTLVDRYNIFYGWLKEKEFRGHIGECGVPQDPQWLTCLDNLVAVLKTTGTPFHYWAGGPGWRPEPSNTAIEPINGRDEPQMAILERYIR